MDNLVQINDGEQNFEAAYKFVNYEAEQLEFERPPEAPLASVNPYLAENPILDVESELWDEGADQRWKAYQQLRTERKRYFAEQKENRRHGKRHVWRGLNSNPDEQDGVNYNWRLNQDGRPESPKRGFENPKMKSS